MGLRGSYEKDTEILSCLGKKLDETCTGRGRRELVGKMLGLMTMSRG
jgi:hypothetical protein